MNEINHEVSTKGEHKFIGTDIHLGPWSKIYHSRSTGPVFIDANCKIGPHVVIGKYTGFHASTYASRCDIGDFCSFGSRNSISPFNHPVDWASTHEVQYPSLSFFWDERFIKMRRIERTENMVKRSVIGSDVWSGDSAIILSGLTIGDGAIIGAGAVVTKDVPPYAIVAGNPAKIIRYKHTESIIERFLKVRWWRLDLEDLDGLPFNRVEEFLDKVEAIVYEKGLPT